MPHCAECQCWLDDPERENDDGDPVCKPCDDGFTIT